MRRIFIKTTAIAWSDYIYMSEILKITQFSSFLCLSFSDSISSLVPSFLFSLNWYFRSSLKTLKSYCLHIKKVRNNIIDFFFTFSLFIWMSERLTDERSLIKNSSSNSEQSKLLPIAVSSSCLVLLMESFSSPYCNCLIKERNFQIKIGNKRERQS